MPSLISGSKQLDLSRLGRAVYVMIEGHIGCPKKNTYPSNIYREYYISKICTRIINKGKSKYKQIYLDYERNI